MTTADPNGRNVREEDDATVSLLRDDPSAIDLWIVDLDRWSDDGTAPGSVSALDRAASSRIRDAVTARRLLARRSATRQVIGSVLGLSADEVTIARSCPRCGSTEHGRPNVPGTSVRFSVAASGAVAIVAVLRATVLVPQDGSDGGSPDGSDGGSGIGIDVELVVPEAVRPQAALSEAEREALGDLPSTERITGFLRLWTAKEAVLKADARTIADDPSLLDAGELLMADQGRVDGFGTRWFVQRITVPSPGAIPVIVSVADRVGAPVYLHHPLVDSAI